MEQSPAILLRKTKLTETSLIITWLSRDHGKVKTVAKGARRAKSRFAGVLDLGYRCEIQWLPRRHSELHLLTEAALTETYAQIRHDYSRFLLAAYFLELAELLTEPEHPEPECFALLERGLGFLDREPATRRALLFFEEELARLLGLAQEHAAPATALAQHTHRLPAGRAELLERLP